MSDVVADLTIEALAQRVIELEADVHAYRELAHAAIAALYGQTVAGDRLQARYERLLVEYRALRLQLLRKPEAA